jgi:hypothetical protein
MTNGFTQANTNYQYTDEQIEDMNAQLLELMPTAFDEDADQNIVAFYSDQVMENGPLG